MPQRSFYDQNKYDAFTLELKKVCSDIVSGAKKFYFEERVLLLAAIAKIQSQHGNSECQKAV